MSDVVGCRHDLIQAGRTGEICQPGSQASLSAALRRCLRYAGTAFCREHCRQAVAGYSIEAAARGVELAWVSCSRP